MACRWRNAAERSKTRGGYGSAKADAFGHYQDETFGNGVMTFTDFDQASGLMGAREGGVGGGTGLINAAVAWDLNGNLTQRQDLKLTPAVTEVFEYNSLNRFDRSTRNGSQNLDIVLNPSGNITSRQVDVQTPLAYTYTGAQTGCSYYTHTQPRAVRKVGSTVYCYDKNGNMVKRGGSNIAYSSYNLPSVINSGSNSSTLSYGAFRNRFKQVAVSGGTTETTIYVAGQFERVTRPSGVIEYRHHIPGGKSTAAIHTRRTSGVNSTYYVHADHLGSPELLTDNAGAALVRPSFAAYGERRDGTDWSGPPSAADLTAIGNISPRGFTGHEHLDSVGLVHMNGRVYEPAAGRFLSADPIMRLGVSQSTNRYAYVLNNPLNLVDPSGFDVVCTDWDDAKGAHCSDRRDPPSNPSPVPGRPPSHPGGGGGGGEEPQNRGEEPDKPERVREMLKDFFCAPSQQAEAPPIVQDLDNASTVAELTAPLAAGGGTAYAVASGSRANAAIYPMSRDLDRVLRTGGRVGIGFSGAGIVLELLGGNPQGAVYGAIDTIVFGAAAFVAVTGAPAGGWSVPTMASAMYYYGKSGGSEAVIQNELCSN